MDSDQEKCVNIAENDHNILITGQAGTGKTFTVKNIVQRLRQQGKIVALTCYTGIACLQ